MTTGLTKAQKLKLCTGCRDDFYNGKNPLGVKECWSLETAQLTMKKFVHINQVPPWNNKPERTLSCHRRERHVAVAPDQVR